MIFFMLSVHFQLLMIIYVNPGFIIPFLFYISLLFPLIYPRHHFFSRILFKYRFQTIWNLLRCVFISQLKKTHTVPSRLNSSILFISFFFFKLIFSLYTHIDRKPIRTDTVCGQKYNECFNFIMSARGTRCVYVIVRSTLI